MLGDYAKEVKNATKVSSPMIKVSKKEGKWGCQGVAGKGLLHTKMIRNLFIAALDCRLLSTT